MPPLRLAPKWSYSLGKRKVQAATGSGGGGGGGRRRRRREEGEEEEGKKEEEEGEKEEEEEEERRDRAPVCARRSPSNGRNFSFFQLFTNSLIASLAYQQ